MILDMEDHIWLKKHKIFANVTLTFIGIITTNMSANE